VRGKKKRRTLGWTFCPAIWLILSFHLRWLVIKVACRQVVGSTRKYVVLDFLSGVVSGIAVELLIGVRVSPNIYVTVLNILPSEIVLPSLRFPVCLGKSNHLNQVVDVGVDRLVSGQSRGGRMLVIV
jgi:hypothetical protein